MTTKEKTIGQGLSCVGQRFLALSGVLILAVLLIGCGGTETRSSSAPGGSYAMPAPISAPGATPAAANLSSGAPVRASGNADALPMANPQAMGAKIIRNDAITLQVRDVPGVITAAGNVATDLGGYVVSSSTRGSSTDVTGDMTLRVPAEKYDTATARLRALGVMVMKEESTSQDVGEEYVDLTARQKNLELTVNQLQTLLGTARTVDDTLKVQNQLTATQSDLERIRGRIQYLDNRAALSTIMLALTLTPAAKPGPTTDFGGAVRDAWASSLRGLVNFVLLLITVFVGGWWLILFLIAAVFGARWWRRRGPTRQRMQGSLATQPAFSPQPPGGIITQPMTAPLSAPTPPPNEPDAGPPQR